ncbi:inositol monophosphatase family protein, partial [Kitasatospora sp. NPDC059463]|uniref:inositol monophosphatase family protein n=1 Tax=Kitasatospora sp. NPDC059463 TaxID=3346842 RepID=UPI0036BF9475
AGPDPPVWRGSVKSRFLDPSRRRLVEANTTAFGEMTPGRHAAGIEYPDLAEGAMDFILYWRTLPWDHAPGSLLLTEAGGRSARLDGTPYRPEAPGGEDGLLAAADPATWERCREILLAP